MVVLSMLLALCKGNQLVIGGHPSQKASDTAFAVFFDQPTVEKQ